MKLLPALAAALLLAAPATAQSVDPTDDGDWWLVAQSADIVILANGTGRRSGSRVELDLFVMRRKPHGDMIGTRHRAPIDCAAKTADMWTLAVLYAGRAPLALERQGSGMNPVKEPSLAYEFACTEKRAGMRHFANRSRNAVMAEILGEGSAN